MRKIWKFKLDTSVKEIKIPAYKPIARFVRFQKNVYGDGLYVWIEIPEETERWFGYNFYTIVTGDQIPEDVVYVGSAEEPGTKEIVHVYYK